MNVHAVVVGIEEYGGPWALDGPARDAVGFARWLRKKGVPADRIVLFLSPLAANVDVAQAIDIAVRSARAADIHDHFTGPLRETQGDLLVLFWSGHGVIRADNSRRLLCADATPDTLRNLDLTSLLTSLRTDYFGTYRRTIVIVDACANYFESLRLPVTMPDHTFPIGRPDASREQFVLLSAKSGEVSTNLGGAKAGLFSKALLDLLDEETGWPPDMRAIAESIGRQFNTLREAGHASQTPTLFSYTDWAGNEGAIGTIQASGAAPRSTTRRRRMSFTERTALVDAMLELRCMLDPDQRRRVLEQLPNETYRNIPRNPAARLDAFGIVETCELYGTLPDLIEIQRVLEIDREAIQVLETIAIRFGVVHAATETQ
jgi:hypothetical protein